MKISKWALQWKICFNPYPNKQDIEVHLSKKRDKENYSPLQFKHYRRADSWYPETFGLILGSKLNLSEHIESEITKCNKIIGLMNVNFL